MSLYCSALKRLVDQIGDCKLYTVVVSTYEIVIVTTTTVQQVDITFSKVGYKQYKHFVKRKDLIDHVDVDLDNTDELNKENYWE